MRQVTLGLAAVALGGMLLLGGCSGLGTRKDGSASRDRIDTRQPTAESMVAYLNRNAQKMQGLQVADVTLDCKAGNESGVVSGRMDCQRPRNFRLTAKAVGQPMADIGSNGTEFWYWIGKGSPYVFHCSYEALERGGVALPFPFSPDMILAALGMAEYNPAGRYEVKVNPRTVELIEATTVQGQPVQKVTVFNRNPATRDQPVVVAHILRDGQGREVCSATISEVRFDPTTGAVVPRRIRLYCQADKVEMKMKLDGIRVAPIEPGLATTLFSRRNLASRPAYDLALRRPDTAAGQVQRAGFEPR
jgi:hypothetical protein